VNKRLDAFFSRELENNLRAAEILYTLTYQGARQMGDAAAVTHFSSAYLDLVQVRTPFRAFFEDQLIVGEVSNGQT
jgi:hypothetical protein